MEFGDGKTRYEKAGKARHDHLIDVESGAIVEFCSPEIEEAIRKAAAALGYNLSSSPQVFGQAQKPGLPGPCVGQDHDLDAQPVDDLNGQSSVGPDERRLPAKSIARTYRPAGRVLSHEGRGFLKVEIVEHGHPR